MTEPRTLYRRTRCNGNVPTIHYDPDCRLLGQANRARPIPHTMAADDWPRCSGCTDAEPAENTGVFDGTCPFCGEEPVRDLGRHIPNHCPEIPAGAEGVGDV